MSPIKEKSSCHKPYMLKTSKAKCMDFILDGLSFLVDYWHTTY